MGVIDRAKQVSGLAEREDGYEPYLCLTCGAEFEVQYHACPACGSFDLRRACWVHEVD